MPHTSHFTPGNDLIPTVSEDGPYSKNGANHTSITVNVHTAWDGCTSNEATTTLFHNNSSLLFTMSHTIWHYIYILKVTGNRTTWNLRITVLVNLSWCCLYCNDGDGRISCNISTLLPDCRVSCSQKQ